MTPKVEVTSSLRSYLYLALFTAGALLVHGYHPGIEDAEIYGPGIKKLLNPELYPFGAEFFLNHARLTLFDELIAASVRATHLSFDLTIFIWYVASTFLTLLACWRLSVECFRKPEAQWSAVALVAVLLTLSVAGTALYIADQYLTPRSIVTFALLFATLSALKGRKMAWAAWSIVAICIHPLMAFIGLSYTFILWLMRWQRASIGKWNLLASAMLPLNVIPPLTNAYKEALSTRPYFFLLQWRWYEWVGAIAPLFLLWWIARFSQRQSKPTIHLMSRALSIYGICYLVMGLVLTVPARFQTVARLQPMRSLHLLYILMFLFVGGLIGEYVLQKRLWRWMVLFLPLCVVMFLAQRQLFPASPHIEWPNAAPANDWLCAFDWIRHNTPPDAVFAIDPEYMDKDDQHGFRVIAERSRLADAMKDSGAVTMFPDQPAPVHWLEQLTAERGWHHFEEKDFQQLKRLYGISWALLEGPICLTLKCPYENQTLFVCRVD
jgi:uncharacterized protein DUF6798